MQPHHHADPLTAFRTLVMSDVRLQAQLGAPDTVDAFMPVALAIAAANGIALEPDAIRSGTRPDPAGMERFLPNPRTSDTWLPPGWMPARWTPTGGAPAFDWIWFGAHRPTEPFFEETIRRFDCLPFNRLFRTRLDAKAMLAGHAAHGGTEPSGFVFHMTRCGSTLVAQMLAAEPANIVLSEPDPIDGVVRWAFESGAPHAQQVALLRAVVAALGRDRARAGERLFVKLESWHTLALPLFRAAFPDTPWAFVYRDPVEVLVSHAKAPGTQTIPGMLPQAALDVHAVAGMESERFTGLSLAPILAAAAAHVGDGGLLVDYAEMPKGVLARVLPHFGWWPSAEQRAAVLTAAARDAKAPDRVFTPDQDAKHRSATPAIIAAAREFLAAPFATLEAMRSR